MLSLETPDTKRVGLPLNGCDFSPSSHALPVLHELGGFMETKPCMGCKETKSLVEFAINRREKDGHQYWCRACVKAYHATYYSANHKKVCAQQRSYRESHLEYEYLRHRAYNKTPAGKAVRRRCYTKIHSTPIGKFKKRARAMVNRHICAGKLFRPDVCSACGKPPCGLGKIHAHHDDYSKPLDIRWLCLRCDLAAHRKDSKK